MELVSWKTEVKSTGKVTFSIKIWEKYRNTKIKKQGKIIVKEANSKFILMLKVIWFLMLNYEKI